MILLDKYVNFLVKHDLTEKEFLVLFMLYKQDYVSKAVYKKGFKLKNVSTKEDKEVLVRKGFLTRTWLGDYILDKKFHELFVDKDEAANQIYNEYPSFNNEGNNPNLPLKNMDRSIFAVMYFNAIMGSIEEHDQIIQDIRYGKSKRLLTMDIKDFLKSQYWKTIRNIRLDDIATTP